MKKILAVIVLAAALVPSGTAAHGETSEASTAAPVASSPEARYEEDGLDPSQEASSQTRNEAVSPLLLGGVLALLVGLSGLIYAFARK